MARIGGFNLGKRREELLSSYEGEEPYMPGGYETPYDGEEPYLPEGYEDDYDDAPYDDDYGYGDPYGEGSRYDDDYGYDAAYGYDGDGYPPEDGDYDRAPYYDGPDYEPEPDYPRSPLTRFVDENEWVTWLLLVLLPPLGIYLLWRRGRFDSPSGIIPGLVSAAWFVAVVTLLILRPFRPAGDTTITPQPVGAAMLPAPQVSAEEEAEPVSSVISAEEVDEANAVYVVSGAPFYHQGDSCSAISEGSELSRVSRSSAIENSLLACPYCMAGQYSDGMWDLVFVDAGTDDRSNTLVYCSAFNARFHTDANCSDIAGDAHQVGLKDALMMAKTACDVCCPEFGREVYCTLDGNYYHVEDQCSGMRNASHVTYAEARVTGKKRCPVCIGGEDETETDAATTGYYVYATAKGNFYHVNATCSGMKDAQQVLLSDMIKKGRPPCPVCCPDAETTVFAETGNPYYHSYATCSGMTQATQGILVNALATGLQRCPVCWTTGGTS